MSTPKPTAPVKARAVVDQDGTFDIENVFGSEWESDKWCGRLMGEQIVPVLITPLTPEGQEKEMNYRYCWGPRWPNVLGGGFSRKGQTCKVIARGKMNSALIEFEDGFRAVISRNALRRIGK